MVRRYDKEVTLNYRIQIPNQQTWDRGREAPGEELDLGAFKCLDIQGDRETVVHITVSRTQLE